jgi:hypothetical protein
MKNKEENSSPLSVASTKNIDSKFHSHRESGFKSPKIKEVEVI